MGTTAFLHQLEADALAAIRTAFPVSEPPSRSEMRNDHCEECREVSGILGGKRWDVVTTADLRRVHDGLPLLTEAAFHYYLPAVMLGCIAAPEVLDVMPDSLLAALSPPNGRPDGRLAYVSGRLDAPQVRAVIAFSPSAMPGKRRRSLVPTRSTPRPWPLYHRRVSWRGRSPTGRVSSRRREASSKPAKTPEFRLPEQFSRGELQSSRRRPGPPSREPRRSRRPAGPSR